MRNFRIWKLLIVLCFVAADVFPQPPPPPPPDDPGEPVPISGIEILLGAGALLGGRQLLKKKKS